MCKMRFRIIKYACVFYLETTLYEAARDLGLANAEKVWERANEHKMHASWDAFTLNIR